MKAVADLGVISMAHAALPTADRRRLPSVAERPGADVLIYDGHCRICTGQVARLARWDGGGRLAFLSLHDPLVAERYPDLSHDELMRHMVVVDQAGGRHRGAAAVRYLSRRLPSLWWLAPVMHIPFSLPLWQWMYQQVASRRYRFGRTDDCTDGACSIHFKRD
jgi:predicted DCC family thiol-disulfide oxidoreductase YuxK